MAWTRRTKIVATVGPATAGPDGIGKLIRAGADCLRFNFSHGSAAEHARAMETAREAARRAGRVVALLGDLCGPKIRTGPAPQAGVELKTGSDIEVAPGSMESSKRLIGVTYPGLAREVRPGQRILLADGRLELAVLSSLGRTLQARIVRGGTLGSRKGVNLPDTKLSAPALTAKDLSDLKAMAGAGPDYVALSFVRSSRDLAVCRKAMDGVGLREAGLVAKIERPEALLDLEAILSACDGIMVARGDLGVEMPAERVPSAQRLMAETAARFDRVCIVATEMMESMIANPRPTRAEVSDVACAVRDRADAVMLSAETSIGRHPFEAVKAMARVLEAAEADQASSGELAGPAGRESRGGTEDAVALAAKLLIHEVGGAVLAVATGTGRTALYLSKSRPDVPILGMSPSQEAVRRMALYWGVHPLRVRVLRRQADILDEARRSARRFLGARRGSQMVVLRGDALWQRGGINTLHLTGVRP